jgi:outer membrane biogenesis lipoprotein LolB
MKLILILLAAATLTGCVQYNARRQAESVQMQMGDDDAHCRSYGAQPGSSAYVQCRMNLDQMHAQGQQQRRAILGAYLLHH